MNIYTGRNDHRKGGRQTEGRFGMPAPCLVTFRSQDGGGEGTKFTSEEISLHFRNRHMDYFCGTKRADSRKDLKGKTKAPMSSLPALPHASKLLRQEFNNTMERSGSQGSSFVLDSKKAIQQAHLDILKDASVFEQEGIVNLGKSKAKKKKLADVATSSNEVKDAILHIPGPITESSDLEAPVQILSAISDSEGSVLSNKSKEDTSSDYQPIDDGTSSDSSASVEVQEWKESNKSMKPVDPEHLVEIDGVLLNLGPKSKRKRARAFTKAELEEIVRFLDEHDYEEAEKGHIIDHKTEVMHSLSCHLFNVFGTAHTSRQCQKRWHDLKNRQTKLLISIRAKIRKEKSTMSTQLHSERRMEAEEPKLTTVEHVELNLPIIDDNIVTLTLHPVTEQNITQSLPPNNNVAPLENWETRVEQIVSQHVCEMKQEILQVIENKMQSILENQAKILSHMQLLEQQMNK